MISQEFAQALARVSFTPLPRRVATAAQNRPVVSSWVLAAGMAAAAVGLLLTLVHPAADRSTLGAIAVLGLVLCFAVAEASVVHLEIGPNAYSLSVSDACLAFALLAFPSGATVTARLVGGTAALLIARQRPIKLAFNVCSWSVESCVAVIVFGWLHGNGDAVASAWAPATAATVVAAGWQTMAVCAALSVHGASLTSRTVRALVVSGLAGAALGSTVATVAYSAISWDPLAVVPLAASGTALAAAYQGHARLRARNEALRSLYDATKCLASPSDSEEVYANVLRTARESLRAKMAELLVLDEDSWTRVHVGNDGAVVAEPLTPDADAAASLAYSRARGDRAAVAATRWLTMRQPSRRGTSSIVAALPVAASTRGLLRVCDRIGDVATFSREDVRLLDAVASQAAAAMDRARLLEQLKHDSEHDPLTGLANRTAFQEHVRRSLAASERAAVLLMDLDRFKDINDTLGHHRGDLLLTQVAARLLRVTRADDRLARLGGDEFAIHLRVPDAEAALAGAARVAEALSAPFLLEGLSVPVRASVGVALAPDHGDTATTLLRRADVAMYTAKRRQDGAVVYDTAQDDRSPRRLRLATELAAAIAAGQLELHFQPQLDAKTRSILGAEALVRWRHPELGLLAPDEFLPIAERTGDIRALTRWVVRQASAHAAAWRSQGRRLELSVNVSVRNLLEPDLPDAVAHEARAAGLPPDALTLEITETHIMADADRTLGALQRLHDAGVRLSIDDFGTGYSSLAHLHLMPVRELKIDKSFVFGLSAPTDSASAPARNIVISILSLARSLGLTVVAEGVETATAADDLAALGCHRLQGYAFSRPLPPDDFERWLGAHGGAGDAVPAQRGTRCSATAATCPP